MTPDQIEFEIVNHADLRRVREGTLSADQVRRTRLRGEMDPETAHTILPLDVLESIGLAPVGSVEMRDPATETARRSMCEDVLVEVSGRSALSNAIVAPPGTVARLGVAVLADLGLYTW